MSFNFGPTLLNWLEAHTSRYLRAYPCGRPREHSQTQGHGNAIAQGYNHAILPLCNERDRRTQIRWGIADFRHRFGRLPEAIWLPETACNDATLGTMIDAGILYVILSPTPSPTRASTWRWRMAGRLRWQHRSAPLLSLFPSRRFGALNRDILLRPGIALAIAFEGALAWSSNLVDRLARARGRRMVNVATDGESYGHHFKFGDRCLAYSLEVEAPSRGLDLTNYGEFLANHPPRDEVEIKSGPDGQGTAWSCQHGVGRWYRDCGCQTDGARGLEPALARTAAPGV